MAQELVYTSTPRGLRLGSSGFCTVACTRGMAPNYIETLESLSGYTPLFPPNHPQASTNPLAFSHYRFTIGGKPVSVLSRVAAAGVDYTKRPNKFAHHLVLDIRERSDGGPAWVMRQPSIFMEHWEGDPQFLDQPRKIPTGDPAPSPCETWQSQLGDASWAGVLANAFLEDPTRPSFIIFKPGMPLLTLIDEAIRLLPIERRWDVTFSTYFTSLPARTACAWRCCLAGSRVLKQARRMPDALVLDLEAGNEQPLNARRNLQDGSPLIEYARLGRPPSVLSSNLPSQKQDRNAAPLAMEPEKPPPINVRETHPRSPADVWLESAPREPMPNRTRGLKITLCAVIAMLIVSLVATVLLLAKRSGPTQTDTQPAPLVQNYHRTSPNNTLSQQTVAASPQDSREVKQLKSNVAHLKTARDLLKAENLELKQANKTLTTERDSLRADLNSTKAELAKITSEHNQLLTAQRPSTVAVLGYLNRLNLDNYPTYELPLYGLSANAKVIAVGWWDEKDAIQQKEIAHDGDALVISAADPIDGRLVQWVKISVSEKAIVFNKMPNSPQTSGKMQKLNNIGWIQLAAGGSKVVMFTKKRPADKIILKQHKTTDSPLIRFRGSVNVQPVLLKKDVNPEWNATEDVEDWSALKKSILEELEFTATFEENKTIDIQQAFAHPLNLCCDGQAIASFNLSIDNN